MRKVVFVLILIIIVSCKKKYVETVPTVSLTQMSSPVSTDLNSVNFISSTLGFISGINGKVYKTSDGGNSWTNISLTSTTINVRKVLFLNSQNGFLATGGGIYITTNGGTTWTNQLSNSVNDIQFVTNNIGYAIGTGGSSYNAHVYKTWDAGLTWTNYSGSYLYSNLNAVSFINKDTGYIAGDETHVFETVDGGNTWTASGGAVMWGAKAYSGKVSDIYCTGYRTGYLTGNTGCLNSFDPSASTPLINKYEYDVNAIAYRNSHVVAVGVKSVLMPYPPLGSGLYSWTYYLSPEATTLPYTYNDVTFSDDNNFFAVGNGGVITKFKYPN